MTAKSSAKQGEGEGEGEGKVNQVLLHDSISQGWQMQQWGALFFPILSTVPIQHPLTLSFLPPEGSSLRMLFFDDS